MSEKKTTKKKLEAVGRIELPTIFADRMALSVRDDDKFLLSWQQNLGDILVEQSRILVDRSHMEKIIDLLVKYTNYYPKEPVTQKTASKSTQIKK